LFDYNNSRAGKCAVDFLDGYHGYMHIDGYKAYEQTQATLVACLAHIRRKFLSASHSATSAFSFFSSAS
jgi:hypothetical protein